MHYLAMIFLFSSLSMVALAEVLSDPTRPHDWHAQYSSNEDQEIVAIEPPLLSVQAVFISIKGNSVMVAGKRYFKGDFLATRRVMMISEKAIVLQSAEGEQQQLKMALPTVKKRSVALQEATP